MKTPRAIPRKTMRTRQGVKTRDEDKLADECEVKDDETD